jgi:predicted DNA-binding mobile mystery protein A
MKSQKQNLILEQVDRKLLAFNTLTDVMRPADGWLHAIRSGIKMSLRQLGEKLNVTPQSIKELETREKHGSVTIDALEKAGKALNMRLVYGFIPEDGSLNEMIEHQARRVATQIVKRTSAYMKLEGQENSEERIEKAIEELTEELKREMPRYLWD